MSYGHRTRKEHLSPAEKRILLILLDKDSAVEMSAEISAVTGYPVPSINNMLVRIYHFFGVQSAKGLLRLADVIQVELQEKVDI